MSDLWSYSELKFVYINLGKSPNHVIAGLVNEKFHGGNGIRSSADINKIRSSKTVFDRKTPEE